MDLKTYLNEKRDIIERALEQFCPRPQGPEADVIEAMHYSLFAGGKRLRPILCLAGTSAVGGEEWDVLPVACALEMVHTYSLIHDDLPVMDNDDTRRGKPTNHKVFGDALAVLAGDGLLTEAFHLMTNRELTKNLDPRLLVDVISLIAMAAGYEGMVGGQAVDIQSEGKAVDATLVEYIHSHKTGAMISASVSSGAILGGGSDREVRAIKEYGEKIGLAFQIADDILDIEGDSLSMGKGVGSDARKKKITYPSVFGLSRSREINHELVKAAVESLNAFDDRADPLRHIAKYIIERKK